MNHTLRINGLAGKARTVAAKITATGIQYQDAMQAALQSEHQKLTKMLEESRAKNGLV